MRKTQYFHSEVYVEIESTAVDWEKKAGFEYLYSKAVLLLAVLQTQNSKNQVSTFCFKKAKLQVLHVSAISVQLHLLFIYLFLI